MLTMADAGLDGDASFRLAAAARAGGARFGKDRSCESFLWSVCPAGCLAEATLVQVTVSEDLAILSLIGIQMRHSVGVAGRFFNTLAEGNVNIQLISQGASEINISCGGSCGTRAGRSFADLPLPRQSSLIRTRQKPSISYIRLACPLQQSMTSSRNASGR